jgi:hypothetical protein
MTDRNKFIEWARNLPKKQLVDVFYEILNDFPRKPEDYVDERPFPTGETRLAIAEVMYSPDYEFEKEGYSCSFIARDVEFDNYKDFEDVLNSCQCSRCKAKLTGASHHLECPICGKYNGAT